MTDKIRVLLADDHPLVRAGLKSTLAAAKEIEMVAEATSGDEVQRLCRESQPDIVLLDLNMPGPPPHETVAYLSEQCPAVKVLILTAYDDDAYVRSLATQVAGYVLKDEATETVVQAIYTVAQGGSWFSRPVVEKMVRWQTEDPGLTEREWQILKLMAQGWENKRIAAEIELAEQSVRKYVSRIYTKLGVTSRAEAVVWAKERGFA